MKEAWKVEGEKVLRERLKQLYELLISVFKPNKKRRRKKRCVEYFTLQKSSKNSLKFCFTYPQIPPTSVAYWNALIPFHEVFIKTRLEEFTLIKFRQERKFGSKFIQRSLNYSDTVPCENQHIFLQKASNLSKTMREVYSKQKTMETIAILSSSSWTFHSITVMYQVLSHQLSKNNTFENHCGWDFSTSLLTSWRIQCFLVCDKFFSCVICYL
jgi:hypothetical protein